MAVADGLLDTSVWIAREIGRPLAVERLPLRAAISIVSVGELRAGVLTAADSETRAIRLTTLSEALALEPLPIDDEVGDQWARLRLALRDRGERMPVNDSWIAATALAHDLAVVTQDDDYDVEVPGLEVIRV